MLVLFNKSLQNKQYDISKEIGIELLFAAIPEEIQTNSTTNSETWDPPAETTLRSAAFIPRKNLPPSCVYPLNVRELFPYWLRIEDGGQGSVLISLTEEYYKWLCCNTTDINDLSVFRLEDILDLEKIPDFLIKHLANSYLNGYPQTAIDEQKISNEKIKNFIDNVKVNFYSKKGTEASFKLLINEFFDIEPDNIKIYYPKKYIFRLNGGRYDWMTTASTDSSLVYNTDLSKFYPQLTGAILNYSVISDGNFWQDYSYQITASGISADLYRETIKNMIHPAGIKDFIQAGQSIFENIQENVVPTTVEIPRIWNYAGYTLGSTISLGHTFGCSGSAAGLTAPFYVFPDWDQEISVKSDATPGLSFGSININDFWELKPLEGEGYPNEDLTCP